MHRIYKTTTFESAHLLEGHPKCGKLHGHSYKLEVWVSSNELVPPYDFVVDFHVISDIAKQYDHSDKVIKVSCEVLTKEIHTQLYQILEKQSDTFHIKVRLWETATSYGEYET